MKNPINIKKLNINDGRFLKMNKKILRFFLSALLYYLVNTFTGNFLVMPDNELTSMSSFLPPLLGIMWGLPAAFGSMTGAFLVEYERWLVLPQILQDGGLLTCLWQALLLFCNCGFWAFIAAYMPWRLGYSIFINHDKPLFELRMDVILKFVWLMFITHITTALFLTMVTPESNMIQALENLKINLGIFGEYALTCFINDFNISIFCGLMWFFFMVSYNYPFERPNIQADIVPDKTLQRAFDVIFVISIVLALLLCDPNMAEYTGAKMSVGFLLCLYMFRPFSPMPRESSKHAKILQKDNILMSRKIAALFYIFVFAIFLMMDISGVIYGLKDVNIWRQYNSECITMINIALIALLCMLLRYHNSIMTNIVLLEVVTVFLSAFALGTVCMTITNRIIDQKVESSISEVSIICRERLERTFNSIQVSVNDIRDLAFAELESYDLLVNDENWRNNYLRKSEHLFRAIASNTEGSVAFYMRLSPDFAGPLGGFSWGRDKGDWQGEEPNFFRRKPIDLSKYAPDDSENVGWYYIPVARQRGVWIDPYIDPIVQNYVISYVSPLYFDNKLVGVVGMDIDFEYLIKEVKNMSIYDNGFVYLMDRRNHILYHKDFKQGDEFVSNPEYREEESYLNNGVWVGIAIPLKQIYAERNNLLMHIVCVMIVITLVMSYLSIYIASRGVQPLVILTEAAQKIAKGNLNVKLPNESHNELGTLVKSIREMVSKLEIYVYRDKLTGLSNTSAYARKCKEIADIIEISPKPYAVIVFDVNFLKRINDTYGHEAGNDLIRCAASTISNAFAESPVFRIGGDEFVAILENKDYERREELLELFDETISHKHFTVGEKTFDISVARGMSIWQEGKDYASIFQEADEAMYAHKIAIKKALGITQDR